MDIRLTVKLILFAIAEMRYGRQARSWSLWRTPRGEFVISPGGPQ